MSFQSQSPDARSPLASPSAVGRTAGFRPADTFGAGVFRWSIEPDDRSHPDPGDHWPGAGPEQPPDDDPVWRWLRKAASWLLQLALEGFATYGKAMYPGVLYEESGTVAAEPEGGGPSHDSHPNGVDSAG